MLGGRRHGPGAQRPGRIALPCRLPRCHTLSALDCLSDDDDDPHAVGALLCFLSFVIPRVSRGILLKKRMLMMELLVRVLRGSGLSANAKVAGIKCVAGLVLLRDDGLGWSDTSKFYGFLLGFVTDSDTAVRREAHQCVRDVLQSFQGSPLVGPASEGFINLFQKLILLAVESQCASAERGAQEILHVLEALKDCLPYISKKCKIAILKYYKTLLEVHNPLVTRGVMDSLNILCLHPTMDVSAELLVDLLASLAGSVGMKETSADGLPFIARLLDVGMRKVHTLNRQICIDKLPPVLSALRDILGAGFAEAKFGATEGMKNLIRTCVDEELIKQGVDRVLISSDLKAGNSSASVIERICAIIGSLLHNRYRSEWDMAFLVLSVLFAKLGKDSSFLLRKTLVDMATLANESDEEFVGRKQLQECMGCALQAIGPEVLLTIIPLNLRADNLSEVNDWLFPIIKQYTVGSSLRFYVKSLLYEVEYLKDTSHKLKIEGRVQSSRVVDSLAYHVWSLLPSFCNYPVDTAESFKVLKKILCEFINKEPDLHGIICSSLQILLQQNKCIVEGSSYDVGEKISVSNGRARAYYTREVASANLKALRSSAQSFLSVLSKVFLESTNDPGGSLQMTIREFASIAEKKVVSNIFKERMKELEKVTQDTAKRRRDMKSCRCRAKVFDLAMSLLPGLSSEETDVLFAGIKGALKHANGLVQKKAYKVLSIILKDSIGFIPRNLKELLYLMTEELPSCHFSAKCHRLDCLFYLINHLAKDEAEQRMDVIISSFLTEILLALKEANKNTRNRAYDVLVQIGHACVDAERGENKENLLHFFNMVAGGLTGGTAHMISAAVKGLARLAYEFSDLILSADDILPSTFLLLQRKNREIVKANLGLLKVLVAKSPADYLQNYLRVMVEGLLYWQDDTKNHFSAKVKHLLEMLVKKCGVDAVKDVMPEEHMKLLTNICKIKERRERKLAANSDTGSYRSRATTFRHSEWGHTRMFSDFDEGTSDKDYMDAETATGQSGMLSYKLKPRASSLRSKKTRSAKASSKDLVHQIEDEPLDLLDQRNTRLAFHSGGKRKLDSDDEPEFDEEGRLIIHDGRKSMEDKKDKESDHEVDDEDKTEVGTYESRNSAEKAAQKRQKTSNSGWAFTGSEYASKKASGDVKKKGKLEPYAYWPLDRKLLSRRPEHKAAARKGMACVAKLTKKLAGRSVVSALSLKTKWLKKKSAKSI